MIKTIAIKLQNPEPMMITWDLGRRCNYDCSYCEATRHNNTSKYKPFDELKTTLEFIKKYLTVYELDRANINFTGGEPTANPIFFEFAEYVKEQGNFGLGLTTNGAFSKKFIPVIKSKFEWVTVSYHAEADTMLKNNVIENILKLHEEDIRLKVNVMMHVDYWDECVEVCNLLKQHGIKYNPRPIGDGNVTVKGWFTDSNGIMRRTSHEYSSEQQAWYFEQMGLPPATGTSKQGTELGRNCCGGRCVVGLVGDTYQEVNLIDTNFKGWYCSVDKYFLHIDQETGNVYHHQTCQATHSGERGPIGNLNNYEDILVSVGKSKNDTIVCPNNRCGCGMCVPKAKDFEVFKDILKTQGRS